VLGYFYLDLHPRDGKHSHACCGPIQQGCLDDKGKRQKAVVVLICNFPRPTADRPSLLSHDDVVTMFHEFGHAMHGICSRAETPLFYGTRVQADFLEAPSQMLENWCYEKEALRLMSKHYKVRHAADFTFTHYEKNSQRICVQTVSHLSLDGRDAAG